MIDKEVIKLVKSFRRKIGNFNTTNGFLFLSFFSAKFQIPFKRKMNTKMRFCEKPRIAIDERIEFTNASKNRTQIWLQISKQDNYFSKVSKLGKSVSSFNFRSLFSLLCCGRIRVYSMDFERDVVFIYKNNEKSLFLKLKNFAKNWLLNLGNIWNFFWMYPFPISKPRKNC